jgi:dipeptidyl aminopeptidase/acylaminoacyl peptidase
MLRTLTALAVALVVFAPLPRQTRAAAQAPAGPFTLEQVMSYPFPDELIASKDGNRIAWTFNERGVRNIYAADAPQFAVRKLTSYDADDGQELTGLPFSDAGQTLAYVRGGAHGSNWPAEGNLMPDPTSVPVQPKMQVWTVPATGGAPKLIAEGDEPAITSKTHRIAFVRDKKIWVVPMDGSGSPEAIFARGSGNSPVWSPDGQTLAFVSDREDHSFIALFSGVDKPLRYLAPSTSRDSDPAWSPDGSRIAFVRQPGRGGVPISPLDVRPQPWALWVADAANDTSREVWKSGSRLVDGIPNIAGNMAPSWVAGDRLAFMGYQDGWPHLYSVPASGGAATLLTPGSFMVEHASVSPDRRFIVYSANAGPDPLDIDRRHIYRVPVEAASPSALTKGTSIEWTPAITSDGRFVVYLQSDAQHPPLPAVQPIDGGAGRRLAADRIPHDFPSAQLVTPQQVIFKAGDGVEVHAQLFKAGAGAAKRPALVYVHGGPPRQMLLGWHYMGYYANDYAVNQYLANRGFIVLSVNYRLGIGYGFAFHRPEKAGARGASEYLDVIAGGHYLQGRDDVDAGRMGIWGGSYGGYLTALALGRNSDVFAAGVDIHGVHDWSRQMRATLNLMPAYAGDGITEDDLRTAARVTYESSPISSVKTWKSPVLLIHGDDDRNVDFHQTVDLRQRLDAQGVKVEEIVIPDDIHDFLLWRSWRTVAGAVSGYFERMLMKPRN